MCLLLFLCVIAGNVMFIESWWSTDHMKVFWMLCGCNRVLICNRTDCSVTGQLEVSGNTTCILYYKAFQGIWLKTILQWGMPSFCCWNKLRLLTKWPFCFAVHDVIWLSIQLPWNSIHTDTDCELDFSLWSQAVGGHCDFLLWAPFVAFSPLPASFLLPLHSVIPIHYCQCAAIPHTTVETQGQCAVWAESQIMLYVYTV